DELEDTWVAVREICADGVARSAGRIGRAETQTPLVGTFLEEYGDALEPDAVRQTGVGHRYACDCLLASDGSLVRMAGRWTRSSSAEMTVSSSAACATTSPHGSTTSDRP